MLGNGSFVAISADLRRRLQAKRGVWSKATFAHAEVGSFDLLRKVGPLKGMGIWSMQWTQIETSLGVYDWSLIDDLATQIKDAGKYISLGLSGGVWMPSFMYAEHSLSSFTFTYDNPNEPTWDGLEFTSPYFWETDYLDVWLSFIQVAADRYKDDPMILEITVGGPQNLFHEFWMPVWYEPIVTAEGWTVQKHIDAWAYVIEGYMDMWPHHLIKMNLGPILSTNQHAEDLVTDVLAFMDPEQGAIASQSMSDTLPTPGSPFADYHQLMKDSGFMVGAEPGEIFMSDGAAWTHPISEQDPVAYAFVIDYLRSLRGTYMHSNAQRVLNPKNYSAYERLKPSGYLPSRSPRPSDKQLNRGLVARQRYMGT